MLLGALGNMNIEAVHALGDKLARANNAAAFQTFALTLAISRKN